MHDVFIGYTASQDVVYQVARSSIERRSRSARCRPIVQKALRDLGIYTRPNGPLESTEFSITRFLTPWLAGYRGWALFMDNDMVVLDDIAGLFALADDRYAVMCVKHDYQPTGTVKLDGKPQTPYPRKNWSSVILWNLEHPKNRMLTPDLINEATALYLHRFMWLEDHEIGELPATWNWLVGWHPETRDPMPKLLHYTEGGPYFRRSRECAYGDVWTHEFALHHGRSWSDADLLD